MWNSKVFHKKKWLILLKVCLNLFILITIIFILWNKKYNLNHLFNLYLILVISFEFIILFLISSRILMLSHALKQNISLKDIYRITITTKFYNMVFPSVVTEVIRGIKYYLAGIKDKYNIMFLVIFDRIIGFITFFIIFIISAFLLKFHEFDRIVMVFLWVLLFLVFIIALFNMDKIRRFLNHKDFFIHLSKKTLFFTMGISLIAQMGIIFKYFFIFRVIVDIDFDFIHTIYICSASHLSQIIPFSTGIFTVKDGVLFFILSKGRGDYTSALNLMAILGVMELFIGIVGGVWESMGIMKKVISHHE